MGKYNFGPIERLNQSLEKYGIDKDIHKKIMESGESIKGKSTQEEKAEWCFNAMNLMDDLLDENTRNKVREDCACLTGGTREKFCKKINKDYSSTEERIKAVNESHYIFGHEIKITGKGKYEVYFFDESIPEKRCSCLNGRLHCINKKWSKTWCYCCGGHVKQHLETILGKKLEVKIIASALTSMGKKSCHFKLNEI